MVEKLRKGMAEDEIDALARLRVAEMGLNEKIACLSGSTSLASYLFDFFVLRHYNRKPYRTRSEGRAGFPGIAFCDGPRGVVTGRGTSFPVAMARGASFDVELEERIGDAIGKEVRAAGGNYFGGVCVNLLRHPAWGRAQETYGEDSFHLGAMGSALVRGVAGHNVVACVKHLAANSIEKSRFKANVRIGGRTLREVYLPHFKACIDAGAASVMGAYNKVEGDHCCESALLLRDVLRGEWGFRGFALSDFIYGVRDGEKAMNAGMDVEMPLTLRWGRKLAKAVRAGRVPETRIDEALLRVLGAMGRAAAAEDPLPAYPPSLMACAEHAALAREAAEKSMVLLKNDGVLPFDRSRVGRVALIGRLADEDNIGDHGSSRVHPPYVRRTREGLRGLLGDIEIDVLDGTDLEAARKATERADAVVVFVGSAHDEEGEFVDSRLDLGGDRASLRLRGEDVALLEALRGFKEKTAAVLIGGSAFLVEDWIEKAGAVLMAFYPGMEGGAALARILFGERSPSGKLPFTIARSEADYPPFAADVEEIEYGYYHGYALLEKEGKEAAFPFGFGLGYTRFEIGPLEARTTDNEAYFAATVRNAGARRGAEVVQLYVACPGSAVDRPAKTLRDFAKIELGPGEEGRVELSVRRSDLAYWDEAARAWKEEDLDFVAEVGNSSRDAGARRTAFRFRA